MILLIIFWILLFLPLTDKTIKYDDETKKNQRNLIISCVAISVCAILFVFPEWKVDYYYDPDDSIELFQDYFNDLIKDFSKIQFNSKVVDLNNAKNRYYTNANHLIVVREKSEELYLKYYSGDVYENNSWTSLEEELYEEINPISFRYSFSWITNYEVGDNIEIITVVDERVGDVFSIYPYYVRSVLTEYDTYYDMYMEYDENVVQFQVWDIDKVKRNNRVVESYKKFIYDYYLSVPENLKELFINEFDLDEKTLKESIEVDESIEKEAEKMILDILKDYRYTLSPGSSPENVDFVEYFLMENEKGYCVHFASAATLMFRHLGIPARYVEGYHVSSEAFESTESGYQANVIDSDAHAWVEIFHDVYGWIPVEVTVGYNTSDDEQQNDEQQENVNRPQVPNNNENNQTNNDEQQENDQPDTPIIDVGKDKKEIPDIVYSIMIGLLVMIIFVLVYLIRVLLRKRSFIQKDNHDSMFALVHYYHKLCNYHHIDDEYLMNLFEKNKFSKNGCSNEEVSFVRNTLENKSKEIYKSISFLKKIKFILIDCLY